MKHQAHSIRNIILPTRFYCRLITPFPLIVNKFANISVGTENTINLVVFSIADDVSLFACTCRFSAMFCIIPFRCAVAIQFTKITSRNRSFVFLKMQFATSQKIA